MQNWNVMLLNLISFLHLVAPAERFCMVVTGTLRQSVGFPGASRELALDYDTLPKLLYMFLDIKRNES